MKLTMPIAAIALAVPAFALAQSAPRDCANPQTQSAMDQCAGASFQKSDKKMNALYRQIEARLTGDPHSTKRLIEAQRDWLRFRDAECNFQASGGDGGSVSPMVFSMCRDNLTQARSKDFESYLHCQEGDLSCPVPAAR